MNDKSIVEVNETAGAFAKKKCNYWIFSSFDSLKTDI